MEICSRRCRWRRSHRPWGAFSHASIAGPTRSNTAFESELYLHYRRRGHTCRRLHSSGTRTYIYRGENCDVYMSFSGSGRLHSLIQRIFILFHNAMKFKHNTGEGNGVWSGLSTVSWDLVEQYWLSSLLKVCIIITHKWSPVFHILISSNVRSGAIWVDSQKRILGQLRFFRN